MKDFWAEKGPFQLRNDAPPPPFPTRQDLVAGRFPGSLHLQSIDETVFRIRGEGGPEPVGEDGWKGVKIRALTELRGQDRLAISFAERRVTPQDEIHNPPQRRNIRCR